MPRISFSEKQIETIARPFQTFEVNEGTPRSGKTTAGIFRAARFYAISEDTNHLITAYNQEQAYKLFIEGDGLGLLHIYDGLCKVRHDDNGDHLLLDLPGGVKRIYYKGGGKADSYKSILGMSFGSVVFCEMDVLHLDMIRECFRRTYAAHIRWHLADLNPPPPHHPVIEMFETYGAEWQHWRVFDNPIITPERAEEIKRECSKSPYLYARDWEGKRVIPVGVIYSMFDPVKHTADKVEGRKLEMFFSGDGGQGDPTSLSCNIVTRHEGAFRLYRAANYYHSGNDTGQIKAMSTYARELKVFMRWCKERFGMAYANVFIDPACKSLREELHKIGVPTRPAKNNGNERVKGKKGIEVGIERLQNAIEDGFFYLLDTEEYGHFDFLQEVGMYCRDKNGKPVDAYNHALDEARYAINYFYMQYPNAGKQG